MSFDHNTLYRSQVISCTVLGCDCEGFQPEKVNLRSCGQCQHGWVVHGKNKLLLFSVLFLFFVSLEVFNAIVTMILMTRMFY